MTTIDTAVTRGQPLSCEPPLCLSRPCTVHPYAAHPYASDPYASHPSQSGSVSIEPSIDTEINRAT